MRNQSFNFVCMITASLLVVFFAGSVCFAECSYVLVGDYNNDCKIDMVDLAMFASNWLTDCSDNPDSSSCIFDPKWQSEPPMLTARDQFTGGVIDGKIYVFGGNGNPDQVNLKSTEVFDPTASEPIDVWTQLADNEHNGGWGVEELTGAVVNNKLYVFGGWGGIGPDGYYGVFNFNEKYDPVTNTWETLAQKPTTSAAGPATVYNNEIYIFGGYYNSEHPSQDHVNYSTVECYNPSTNTWRYVTDMPSQMSNFAIATIGTKAYLFGGAIGNEPPDAQFLDNVITYDFQTGVWCTDGYQPMPVKKAFMYSNSVPVIDGKVYLIGVMEETGGEFVISSRVDIYDTVTDTWQIGTSIPLPQDNFVTLALNSRIYILGGCNNWDYYNRAKNEVISGNIN